MDYLKHRFTSDMSSGKSRISKASAYALVMSMTLTMLTGISTPAHATNDMTTYLDEGFNTTGYFNQTINGLSSVSVKGVILNTSDLRHRRIVASLENGRALLRAYVPTGVPTLGYVNSWGQPAGHRTPDYDYQVDSTFGVSGALDLGIANVTEFLVSKSDSLDNRPAFLISTASSHHVVKFNSDEILKTCNNTSNNCGFTTTNITSIFTNLLGAGATVPSAFSSQPFVQTHVYVSGKLGGSGSDAGKPYVIRVRLSDSSITESRVIPFPAGYTAGWTYTPVVGGMDGTEVSVAGNLTKTGEVSAGVVFRLNNTTLADAASAPVNVFAIGTAETTINFLSSYYVFGGSYKDTSGLARPFVALYNNSSNVFRISKLTVSPDSQTDETLLSANYAESSAPAGGSVPVMAIGTDNGLVRVYTWASHANQDNVNPTHSEVMSFGGVAGTPATAYIPRATFNNSFTSGLMAYVGFNSPNSTISISAYQSALAFPGLTEHVTLTKDTNQHRLIPSRSAPNNPPLVQGLTGNATMTWYRCSAAVANPTALQTSAANPPAGCTAYGVADGASFFGGRLEYRSSNPRVTGHFLVGFSYSNPTFNYYSASVEVTSADITISSGGGGGGGSSPSVNSPSVTSVTPLRQGAQVAFVAPGGNPVGTTYRVTALQGGNPVVTATGSTSPVTVAGLQDGVSYTFHITAIGPTGVTASAGTASSASSTLQPGSTDTSFFSGTPNPSVTGTVNSVLQPSGNIYSIGADVRRILPTGSLDSNFGTSGTYALPGGLTGTVVDVVEDPATGSQNPSTYLLVRETSTNLLKVVKLSYSGVLDTSFGTSGILSPTQPTAPSNPLAPQLTISQGVPSVVIPGADLPAGNILGTNFVVVDEATGPIGSPLAGATVVVGTADGTGGSNLVVSALQTSGGIAAVAPGFNNGTPITISRTSGVTSVAGVSVDPAGNIYVLASINGATSVLAYSSNGAALTNFGNSGQLVIAGATTPRGIEIVNERVIVTTSDGTNTAIRSVFTPAGFNALPLAVASGQSGSGSSGQGSQGGGGSQAPSPAPFTGPIVTQFSSSTLRAGVPSSVTLAGQNLNSVTALVIGTAVATFTTNSQGELFVNVPALSPGVYDMKITYGTGAMVIHQSAFSVIVRASASRTVRVANLNGDRFELTQAARTTIAATIRTFTEAQSIVCTGSTSGTRATASDRRLALRRAQEACELAKRLVPGVITEVRANPASGVGPRFRSVTVQISGN